MSAHTPGPWATLDGAEVWPEHGPRSHVELARVVGPWDKSAFYGAEEARANARLIAAAPAMLAALEAVEIMIGQHDDDGHQPSLANRPAIQAARAAIASATGQERAS